MYVRIVTSKQKHATYRSVQIVESYRDRKKSKHPITKIIANLGPVDKLTERDVDNINNGVCKAIGRPAAKESCLETAFDFGHIYAVLEIWKQLKIGAILKKKAEKNGQSFDLEDHIKVMVTNRLCDPRSKLGLIQWLEGVYFPGIDRDRMEYHHLLRAMDWLIDQKEAIEKEIANRLITLFDREVDLVFYDITSTYFEGDQSITADDIRAYGYSRDHRPDRRQITIGIVMSRAGIPLCHHVFCGSTPDKNTVSEVVMDLKERFGFERVIFVGDRGMLSDGNLELLLTEKLGFIVCHRLRQNNEIKKFVRDTHDTLNHDPGAKQQYLEDEREQVKFVMAYDPAMAETLRKKREQGLKRANGFIQDVKERLKKSRDGNQRGRALSAESALFQVRDYLKSHNLLRYYNLELASEQDIRITSNSQSRQWEALVEGKLIVETTQVDMSPEEVIKRYKELQIIEQGFKSLKSALKLRPVYHWTERRIKAHVFICVLALQVERFMRFKLSVIKQSVQSALDKLKNIKAGQMVVNSARIPVITALNDEHKRIYRQLGLSFPNIKHLQGM